MLLFWVQAHSDGKSDITIKTEWDRRQALITGVSLLFFICTAQRRNMGSVEISRERIPCVGPPYIRIVISWHDIIISWHDIIISWHDTIISCCVWFEARG